MLAKRIIPCLDVKDGFVVKGRQFLNLKYAGEAVELARKYSEQGADELVFLDISATIQKRKTLLELVRKVAQNIFIPFTVGGGIRSIVQIREVLASGADKVSLNTAAVEKPELISSSAAMFGSQAIVVAIDARKVGNSWQVFTCGGQKPTNIDVIRWARKVEQLGAGEILLTSIDRDGTAEGADINLLRQVTGAVNVPVIASGGIGTKKQFRETFTRGRADAALAASVFHYNNLSIAQIKSYLADNGVRMRK